jgi:D-xylose transport system substrate-binding protein
MIIFSKNLRLFTAKICFFIDINKILFIMKNSLFQKVQVIIVIVLLLPFVFSCKSFSEIKIGLLIPAGEGYRWPVDQSYIEKAAKEKGIEVVTRIANNDENLQLKQAKELLELGVDVLIVVAANANTAAAIVRDAHDYNVPVIGYDRLIKNSDLDYFVTFEGAQIGGLMIDYALQHKPEGNYVLLWGDPGDVNAIFIKEAQEKLLKPSIDNGKINIVYKTFVEDWSMENAYHITKNVLSLTGKKIDAIITSYDGLAMGARKAMDELNYDSDVILTGQDAEIAVIKAISENRMSLTIYKSIKQIADASVDLADKLATKKKVANATAKINNGRKDVPTIFLKPVAVTKDNIRQTVIADGFYTEQQVYGSN